MLCSIASDKRLLFLIAGSCGLLEVVYRANIDIALYYGVAAMISVMTAFIGLLIKTTSGKVLAIFMLMQAAICLALIPHWHFTGNEFLQYKLEEFNVILVFILIALGITSSDR
jgi:Na+(H+)/acetate symporter ActP